MAKFCVVKDGKLDANATAERLAKVMTDFVGEVTALDGDNWKGYEKNKQGIEVPVSTFYIDPEVRATIKRGIVTLGAFKADPALIDRNGAGRALTVDLISLQTIYSDTKRDKPAYTDAQLSNAVSMTYNMAQDGAEKWTDPTAVRRYLKEGKLQNVPTPAVISS